MECKKRAFHVQNISLYTEYTQKNYNNTYNLTNEEMFFDTPTSSILEVQFYSRIKIFCLL